MNKRIIFSSLISISALLIACEKEGTEDLICSTEDPSPITPIDSTITYRMLVNGSPYGSTSSEEFIYTVKYFGTSPNDTITSQSSTSSIGLRLHGFNIRGFTFRSNTQFLTSNACLNTFIHIPNGDIDSEIELPSSEPYDITTGLDDYHKCDSYIAFRLYWKFWKIDSLSVSYVDSTKAKINYLSAHTVNEDGSKTTGSRSKYIGVSFERKTN